MKSCPNATCSFALKFKRAGEYQDTATSCSDCGGPLVEGPTAPPASLKAAAVMVVPSDANQRLAVTVGGALAFAALSQLPVMGTAGVSMEEVPSSSVGGSADSEPPDVGTAVGMPMALMLLESSTGVASATMGILTITLACVVIDVVDEWSARRRLGPLISVWEVQRTAEVEPIFFLLRGAGIEAHARSFLFRATQQFFAPWVPVGILVPVAREAEARALMATRLPAK